MAYNTKYRFRFDSCHGVAYEVRLKENGYSGSVIDRPLGRAPVIRMQEADPFRPTSCDLALECQVDGEYVDLYTTDPRQYKVEVYHKTGASSYTIIWEGYVAVELYSEPDIAPPYDVKITATDGLAILKEYTFEAGGNKTLRDHLVDMMQVTGDSHPNIYMASRLRVYGESGNDFLDETTINLDHLAGKTCYEVLGELMKSLRCIITFRGSYWLIIREVDVQITSGGNLSVLYFSDDPDYATADDTLQLGKKVGKMGASATDMWPVGYLTRRVVPAKKSVKVTAPWNLRDGSPDIASTSWIAQDDASASGQPRYLGTLGGTGVIFAQHAMANFTMDVKVTVKCWRGSVWQNYNGTPYVKVLAMYNSQGGGTKYYHPDTGWTTTSPSTGEEHTVDRTNRSSDPAQAQEITVNIPSPNDVNGGGLTIYVVGHLLAVWDVDVELIMMKGYEDTLLIDNGARGTAPDLTILGSREIDTFLVPGGFAYGIWFLDQDIVTAFSDLSNTNKDWMSLTALAYAKEHASPRLEITGKLDNPYASPMLLPPMFIQSHGVWALLSTYDWDLLNEDIDFKAITLPTATLTVDSEEITSY